MTPPETTLPRRNAGQVSPPAGLLRLEVLQQRSDFLAAARGKRVPTHSFLLQIRDRKDDGPARVGFTCSKKVGNAVARNRAKRRLRELARLALTPMARTGHDYVLVGRANATANHPFPQMILDLEKALKKQP
ncbi:MAG: ribonuclease P protein component [Paracoccaceae bacterium]